MQLTVPMPQLIPKSDESLSNFDVWIRSDVEKTISNPTLGPVPRLGGLPVSQIQIPLFVIDDSVTRRKLWHSLFPSLEMPTFEVGVVEKYSGVLDKYLPKRPSSSETLDRILRQVKGKGVSRF